MSKGYDKGLNKFRKAAIAFVDELESMFVEEVDEDKEGFLEARKMLQEAKDFDEIEGIVANEFGLMDEEIKALYQDALIED